MKTDKQKLFAIYLGGRADRCNIELHDVVFAIGASIEDTYPQLGKKWFGNYNRYHIDSYIELKYVDGYEIQLVKKKSEKSEPNKLFFVNFGAYEENLFGEVHQCAFYVGKEKAEAIQKAKKNLCINMIQTHCDDNLVVDDHVETAFGEFDLDDLIEIDQVDGYHLTFTPLKENLVSKAVPGYIKLLQYK